MMTKHNTIKCDQCGQFVRYQDILDGLAHHFMIYPSSHFTEETWDTLCRKCKKVKD